MVEQGSKNPASVYGLARELGFGTLPDLFFSIHPRKPEDIDGLVDALDFNRKVKEVLKRKLRTYLEWRLSTFDELKSSGKIQLIQSNQIQDAISDYYVDLDYINVQLVYFRNQFTDPVSAAPNDYWFTYNPDFEMKINWNFDFENLANNRVFVSKHTKALRDQIVFQKYYKEHLLPSAQEMCRKLGRALDASCSSEINN